MFERFSVVTLFAACLLLSGSPASAQGAHREILRNKLQDDLVAVIENYEAIAGLHIGDLTNGDRWAIRNGIEHWQTMVFTVLVFAQLFRSLAIRSERYSLLSIGLTSNPALIIAVIATMAAQLLVICVPALNVVFHTAPLSLSQLGACVGIGAIVLLIVEIEKLFRRRGRTIINVDEFPISMNGDPGTTRTASVVLECYVVRRYLQSRCVLHTLISHKQGRTPRNLPGTMSGSLQNQF